MSGGGHIAGVVGVAARLDALDEATADAALARCCAARRWRQGMLARRPFGTDAALFAAAEEVWQGLGPEDWREAFAAHPRIGERAAAGDPSAAWSGQEQAGTRDAAGEVRAALAAANAAYEARFGHVFLIRASGRSAEAMLAACRRRMANDPETELRVAAAEQAEITRLRLAKLAEGFEGGTPS